PIGLSDKRTPRSSILATVMSSPGQADSSSTRVLLTLKAAWRAVHAVHEVACEPLRIEERHGAAEALPKLRLVPIAIAPAHQDVDALCTGPHLPSLWRKYLARHVPA